MGKHLIPGHIIAECLNRVLISKTLHFFLPLFPIHTIHDACALLSYLIWGDGNRLPRAFLSFDGHSARSLMLLYASDNVEALIRP